jgi:hypothetical protein
MQTACIRFLRDFVRTATPRFRPGFCTRWTLDPRDSRSRSEAPVDMAAGLRKQPVKIYKATSVSCSVVCCKLQGNTD